MTTLSNRPVNNGERLFVSSSFYSGLAGVRRVETGGEFACLSQEVYLRDPAAKVGGRSVTIRGIRKSDTATGMIVADFDYVEESR